MIAKERLNLNYFITIFRRRLWYVVLPFFVVMSAILVYCIKAPKIYRSSTLVLIQPQEVPEHYVTPTVTSDVRSRLKAIAEQILSRSRLEKIIDGYDLYPEARSVGSMYDAVEKMREKIEINFKEGMNRHDSPPAFEVAFHGRDPVKVRDVVADLGNIFLEENLEIRAKQAAGTSKFLERELERMRDDLRHKEELVRQFREQYMGFLPEQMQNNQQILGQLQQQLDSLNTALQNTEDRKILLQSQLNKLNTMQVGDLGEGGLSSGSHEAQLPSNLGELHTRLHSLKSRYTDQHPDVVRLAAIIEKLEKAQKTTPSGTSSQGHSLSFPLTETQQLVLVQKEDLVTKLDLIDNEIRSLKKEKNRTARMIEQYRDRIEKGPLVEQKFLDLRRDYEMASENYQSLLKKKLESNLAEDLERTQKGEQFKIQDPANLPTKPFKPDIWRVLAIGLMLALASAFGIAYLREYLDPTFWLTKDLETALQLPVLTSVPVIFTDKERRWSVCKKAFTACVLVSMVTVLLYGLYLVLAQTPKLVL